jgi:hypothetical protein
LITPAAMSMEDISAQSQYGVRPIP